MPETIVNGTRLAYVDVGQGPETIAFAHGLLWSKAMYEPQIAALSEGYRCVAWDHRGQGESESPRERAHTIEACYDDAVAFLEAINAVPCHLVGLSMGGFVAMRVAARRPDLVRSLTLISTTADPEVQANRRKYRLLAEIVRFFGASLVASRVMSIMFGATFLSDPDRAELHAEWRAHLVSNRKTIHRAVRGVIEREGFMNDLARVACPVLVLHGDEDAAIARARAETTHHGLPDSRFIAIPGAGHTPTIEAPEAVVDAITVFLAEVTSTEAVRPTSL